MVSGGRQGARRCSLVGHLAATKGRRSRVETVFSRLVIETMSNPSLYCSRASPKVQCSGPHWIKNSSTHVDRRPWRMRLGSLRASICWMKALSPGASLPRRDSMVMAPLRLEPACRREAPHFSLAGKIRTTRVNCVQLAFAWVAARCASDLSIYGELIGCSVDIQRGWSV